jgi:glycosyltransferase involved in cell wall biosynthesis
MVEKKNLATLVSAYARYAQGVAVAGEKLKVKGDDVEKQAPVALVFVGSGELESALREQARSLGLRVVDCTAAGSQSSGVSRQEGTAANCKLQTEHSVESDRGAVFFYGFRQIEENAVFYALAEAFVLPSLKEEWGLVVNEAMACSLPVIVSRTAGCAEDLLPGSESWQCSVGSIQFGEERTTDDCKPLTDDSLEERSNGFVFDPRSVDALSEALRRIADPLNPKRSTLNAAAMGRRSREIVAKFGCENFAKQAMRAAEATRH